MAAPSKWHPWKKTEEDLRKAVVAYEKEDWRKRIEEDWRKLVAENYTVMNPLLSASGSAFSGTSIPDITIQAIMKKPIKSKDLFKVAEAKRKPDIKGKERLYSTPFGDLPSVTTVLATINKPWLVPWILKLSRKASVESVMALIKSGAIADMDEDTLDDVFKEAGKKHLEVSEAATDLGSLLHGAVEFYFKEITTHGMTMPSFIEFLEQYYPAPFGDMLRAFFVMLKDNDLYVTASEQTVYSKHGYAGTLDLILTKGGGSKAPSSVYVADIKTTKKERFKDGVPADIAMQLTAYKQAVIENGVLKPQYRAVMRIDKVNPLKDSAFLVLSTNEMDDWDGFLSLLNHYQYLKSYKG